MTTLDSAGDGLVQCPHAAACGRCQLIDLPPDVRLERKVAILRRAVARIESLRATGDPPVELAPCTPAPTSTGYLHQVALAVEPATGRRGSHIGFPQTHGRVVDIPDCQTLAPALHASLADLRTKQPADGRHRLVARCDSHGRVQLLLDTHERGCRLGAQRLQLEAGGLSFSLSGSSPVPKNPAQITEQVRIVARWLSRKGPVLAATSGAGILALCVARSLGVRLLLVMENRAARADAARAAASAGIDADVRSGNAQRELERLLPESGPYRAMLVTPPLGGMKRATLIAAAAACRDRAVYVGSDPRTLSRDLGRLRVLGLRAQRLVPVDLEPLTDRAAALALLARVEEPWTPERVYEDTSCVVFVKPNTIPTTGPGSLDALLVAAANGQRQLWPVHRLDAGTSGSVLFARTTGAVQILSDRFARGEVEREYRVLVIGTPLRSGVIDKPLAEQGRRGGKKKPARTRFRLLERFGPYSLLAVHVETGRTHQIRRHLAGSGFPVLGDDRYGKRRVNTAVRQATGLDHPFVHAAALAFDSPGTGKRVAAITPLTAELEWVVEALSKQG